MAGNRRVTPRLVADKKRPTHQRQGTPRAPQRAPKAPRKHRSLIARLISGLFRFVLRTLWAVAWRCGLIVCLLVGLSVLYFATTLPPHKELLDGRAIGSVTLKDRNGEVFAWRGEQFGGIADARSISPHLKNAIIATEDKRFYSHLGVSPRGIASAIRINLREGRGPLSGHGGSTITQQSAKLMCLGTPYDPQVWKTEGAYEADCRRVTLWRKVKEAIYALALEARYSKDEILTIYMNRTFLGAGSRGFEAAAQRYFGKSASQVNVAESAMLAGLLVAPTRYAPTKNLKRSQDRAQVILTLMHEQSYISTEQRDAAKANPAVLSAAAQAKAGGYFADWVMQSGPSYFTRNTTEDVILRTTLDQNIQKAAEDALRYVFDTKLKSGSKAQAAIVVMSADGAVRAMVGGRDTQALGTFNRATQALRQSGSAFKPFVYATALDLGYSPNDIIRDEPITLSIPGSGAWSPKNYSRDYKGDVTLTEAFGQSLNIPAVKLSEAVGRANVRSVAAGFGLTTDLAHGPAIALGVSESTLIQMTGAYAGILNGGSSVTPYGLTDLRLVGDETALMGTSGGIGERVIQEQAAKQLTYMMLRAVQDGTGQRAQMQGWDVAGKTGTTQAARDAWFIGFTADFVTGVWMGYDDNTPLTGTTGGGLPADIWRETMLRVHANNSPKPLPLIIPKELPYQNPRPIDTKDDANSGRNEPSAIENFLRQLFGGGSN